MLTLRHISFSFAHRDLLQGIDWTLHPGRRLALVGANGAGKTTLLRIMAAELDPDTGSVIKSRHYRVGYLPQETVVRGEGSLMQSVLAGRQDILDLETQMEALRRNPPRQEGEHAQWLKRLDDLGARFSSLGGYEMETRARKILSGLGFERSWENRPLAELSGGWRMRALLARLLLTEPDLLLLDEPTNHLDLPSLEWMERFLLGFAGTMVLVSHDRFFIDRLAQEIVELENGRLNHYPGRFRKYLEMRAQRIERAHEQLRQQELERRRQERYIERFRYKATKAAQVQSRIKQLDKMEALAPPPTAVPQMDFRLTLAQTPYRDVLTIKNLGFAYTPGEWVFRGVDLQLARGDKICLVGRNGVGKTTLTRLISRDLSPQEGTVSLGRRAVTGYYAQHQVDALNLERSVYDEVGDAASLAQAPAVRSILGLFGFHGDDVFKKVKVLSGGEKARVSLARILLTGANFLIMDEPTNHLDAYARDALEKALRVFEGTLMLVSHDRYFLDGIVNRVVEIRNGRMLDYRGNYSEYLEKREEPAAEETHSPARESANGRREQRQRQALARQAVSKERNRITAKISKLEDRIEALETRQSGLEEQLAAPDTYDQGEKVVSLQKEYARVRLELETAVSDWEASHQELDELLRDLGDNTAEKPEP